MTGRHKLEATPAVALRTDNRVIGSTRERPKRQRSGECVYCGVIGPVTDDHVPPRSFFPATAPKNLITVPSCAACNQGFGKDDDYARLVLTTTEGAIGNPARDESKLNGLQSEGSQHVRWRASTPL
jgi:5-methylcytosine-specific restriction endonuclease McrA